MLLRETAVSGMNGNMASRVRKLRDMEIDEISLVDRAANQHASILFSKAMDQEDAMPSDEYVELFDSNGRSVTLDDMDVGSVVFDNSGNEYVVAEDNGPVEEPQQYEEREPELVGKSYGPSLGDLLVEELSKSDRDERTSQLAKAAGREIEIAKAQADEAMRYAEQLHEERAAEAFISKAAEYNLPVDPTDLGLILKSVATVLSDDQLDLLDQLFTAIGDDLYEEYGAPGGGDNNDVLSMVDQYSQDLVQKSEGGLSTAEASTLLFENDPSAYEMYLQENGGV